MMIKDVKFIELPKFADPRGNLSFVEQNNHIPFEIKRTYWIYDVPGGESRGGHAYRETAEFIVPISGGFDVTVDDGKEKKTFTLNRSYYGLYIPKGLWRRWRISPLTRLPSNLRTQSSMQMTTFAIMSNLKF